MEPDYYTLLGVAESASESEIRTAFREVVKDAMDDQPRFAALTEAFETLKDPQRRADYDARRAAPLEPEPTLAGATIQMPAGATVQMPSPAVDGACKACGTAPSPGESFCLECGLLLGSTPGALDAPTLAPPTLVDALGRTFTLRMGENLIGREGADITLPDKTVSRRHATLTVAEGNRVTLADLGSTNGTRSSGAPVASGRSVTLADGAALQFGGIRATIHIPSPPEPTRLALPAPTRTTKPVAAIGASPDAAARLIAADGTAHVLKSSATTFGRKAENDVVLTGDAYISGNHARIIYEKGVFSLVDQASTNGTRLRGRKIAPHQPEPLTDGDTIHLGQTPFTFRAPH